MELEEGFGSASGGAGGGGAASPGAGRTECTFPFLFVCSFFAFFLLVVGETYYDRLGRSGQGMVIRKASCRLGSSSAACHGPSACM